MGFYGNITNTARTQFQFDKTFPNRKTMDEGINTDGVYAGRYVLIEYDTDGGFDNLPQIYRSEAGGFYNSADCREETRLRRGDMAIGEMARVETPQGTYDLYMCVGTESSTGYLRFGLMTNSTSTNYSKNYAEDTVYAEQILQVQVGRGWDSTVWQKVYADGSQKYVMIAELNTVVPTYDLVADAPTMTPIVPHYDVDSTNVYYKLHVQPTWGLRVAKEDDPNKSDSQTIWYDPYKYDPGTGKIIPGEENPQVVAAIFFNKKALDPQVGQETIHKHVDGENTISILPTGSSGHEYNTHDDTTYGTAPSNDIQEMRVSLPIFGNTMSDIYDIMHGEKRDNSPYDSLQGKLNNLNELQNDEIPVSKVEPDGHRIVSAKLNGGTNEETGFDKDDDKWIATRVDAEKQAISIHHTYNKIDDTTSTKDINGAGDTYDVKTPLIDDMGHVVGWNTETVTLPFGYKIVETNGRGDGLTDNTDTPTTESVAAAETQDTIYINSGNKWVRIDAIDAEKKLIISHDIHTPDTADAETFDFNDQMDTSSIFLQDIEFDEAGHMTANKRHEYILPYTFRAIQPGRDSENVEDMHSNTIQVQADSVFDTVTIGPGNKWLKISGAASTDTLQLAHLVQPINTEKKPDEEMTGETNSIVVQDITYDEAGHIIGCQPRQITLPSSLQAIQVLTGSEETSQLEPNAEKVVTDEAQDALNLGSANKWIRLAGYDEENKILIAHEIHDISLLEEEKLEDINGTGDELIMTDLITDEAGHIVNKQTHKYTLPYGYKSIVASNNAVNSAPPFTNTTTGLVADNTQDTLKVETSNKWLQVDTSSGKLLIGHALSPAEAGSYGTVEPSRPAFGESFYVPYLETDQAGHVVGIAERAITIHSLSLLKAQNGNVVTGMTLEPLTGEFAEQKAVVADLPLVEYTHAVPKKPADDTTINQAFQYLVTAIDSASGNFDSINDSIQALQEKDTALDGQITSLQTANTKLGERIDALETGSESLTSRIEDLETSQSGQDSQIQSLKDADTQIKASITELKGEDAKLDARITALEEGGGGSGGGGIDPDLAGRVTVLENNQADIKASIASLETGLDQTNTKVAALEKSNTTLTQDMTKAKSDITQLTTDLEEAQSTITQLTSDLATANKNLATATTDLEAAKKTIAELQTLTNSLSTNYTSLLARVVALETDNTADYTGTDSFGTLLGS